MNVFLIIYKIYILDRIKYKNIKFQNGNQRLRELLVNYFYRFNNSRL